MTLSAEEFTRRFLQHVLPKGLMRIRHFGLLATRGRQERLARCRTLLAEQLDYAPGGAPTPAETPAPAHPESWRVCPS